MRWVCFLAKGIFDYESKLEFSLRNSGSIGNMQAYSLRENFIRCFDINRIQFILGLCTISPFADEFKDFGGEKVYQDF